MSTAAKGRGALDPWVWVAPSAAAGEGLAMHVAQVLAMSREAAEDLVDFGSVHVSGRQVQDISARLRGGEEVRVYIPVSGPVRRYELDPARILYRDRHLLAYDKEPGVPSQQTPADAWNNVYSAVLRHAAKVSRVAYAAMHQRLDRETSGVMLFALTRAVNKALSETFSGHRLKKEYLAWVEGEPRGDRWVSCEEIGRAGGRYAAVGNGEGKPSETAFSVLRREPGRSLVLALPKTGRTHQIRIHLAACGHPVVGDVSHGAKPASRLHLHAWRLTLEHPATGALLAIEAPPPEGFAP